MNGILRTMAGLLLVGAAMASSGAQAAWGAIAYSQSTGAAGWSYDAVNEVDAEIRALNNCGKYASDCETAVTFRNGCGALAVGSNGGWGADWGADRYAAQSDALDRCEDHDSGCRVTRWQCSG
jgi:serine/threonine-protein kinase